MNSTIQAAGTQSSAKDKPVTSLRRSCEACRASKGRCCPSQDDVTGCERFCPVEKRGCCLTETSSRCVRDRKQCIFLEAKPRPKRVRTSRTRVTEMEQRLDGILAMLSASSHIPPIKEGNLPEIPYPATPAASDRIDSALLPQSRRIISNVQPLISTTPTLSSWLKFDQLDDVIGKGLISYDKAETLLRGYNTLASNFPFIVFSPTASLDSLRREKPFLLISILTVASTSNLLLQDSLEAELREILGRKVVFNGEKSLDLLQGLLVYLAWYHLFFRPDRQQIYQLSQMVIAMAVDLDISRSDKNSSGGLSPFGFGYSRSDGTRIYRVPLELEAMRTFLGCYYLSSCLSIAFRKPNNLKYTDWVETCCQALCDAKETPSDYLLPYFIRLQRLAEEINTAFDYGGYQQLPSLDAIRTEMLLITFKKQLNQFEESFPSDIWQNVAIRMSFLHINVFVNEIGLYAARPEPVQSIAAAQASCREWYYAVARTETLVACIESAKKYIEAYLSLPEEEVFQNTLMEEIKGLYAILVIGRFTSGVDSPFLDASYLRTTAKFSYYMSAWIDRLNHVILFNGNGQERIDYFWHVRRIYQHTKIWYEEQVKGGIFTTLETIGLPDCMNFAYTELLKLNPEFNHVSPQEVLKAGPVAEEELWTVAMLEAWPTSTLDPRAISFNGGFQ